MALGELLDRRTRGRQAEEALGRHDDERLAERSLHLAAEEMEHLRRRRRVNDLDIVLGTRLEIALEAGA